MPTRIVSRHGRARAGTGSLRYADAALGLTAEATGRFLAAHNACWLAGHGFNAGMRLRAEVDYGLPAFRGRGAVTPFAGLTTTGTLVRDWSAGALWRRGPALEMALEATRGETAGEPPAHGGRAI